MTIFKYIISIYTHNALYNYFVLLYFNLLLSGKT